MIVIMKKIKNIPSDIKIAVLLIVLAILLFIFSPKNLMTIFRENYIIIIKILYLTVFAIIISSLIHFLIPAEFVERHLKRNKFIYLVYAAILGILTPGPVYAIYPIVVVLKKKGVQNSILVSYLTGQTIIGPARIPFEVGIFGAKFFIYRVVLSIAMGTLAGILYILLSKLIPD